VVPAAAQYVADPDAVVGGAKCALREEDDRLSDRLSLFAADPADSQFSAPYVCL
jgi:hypothetical protein